LKSDLEQWDIAFPVIIRYTGLFTTLVLIGFSLAGFYAESAPGFVASGGMILYKTVNDAAQKRSESKE
jgi:hypothetical protein